MRKVVFLVGLVLLAGMPAVAQDYPTAEFFSGFSYFNVDTPAAAQSFFGWQSSFSGNLGKTVGFTADFGGQYKSVAGTTLQTYEYLFGPRLTARGDRVTGFAHVLFGGATARAGAASESGFAMGFGGGLDVNVRQGFAIRVIQLDYIPEHIGGAWGHNVRVGIGFVFKAGGGS